MKLDDDSPELPVFAELSRSRTDSECTLVTACTKYVCFAVSVSGSVSGSVFRELFALLRSGGATETKYLGDVSR